jgi:hypothetical protein
MKCNFIELTETDDSKILLNLFHIAWIEPNKSGSIIRFNITNYSFSKKVKESYQEIRSLIGS